MSAKLINCSVCGTEMASTAKACPKCGAKNKKPIYKKVSFWIFMVLLVLMVGAYTSCAGTFNSAKVTFADSSLKDVTAKEVEKLHDDNQPKWEDLYFNSKVTVTGKVAEVGGSTKLLNAGGKLIYGYVEIADKGNRGWTFCFYPDDENWSKYKDVVESLEVGDTVTATGVIKSSLFTTGVELWKVTDFHKGK